MAGYGWLAVENSDLNVFLENKIPQRGYFSLLGETSSCVDGNNTGIASLASGWALLMVSGDWFYFDEQLSLLPVFAGKNRLAAVNVCTTTMVSEFYLFGKHGKLQTKVIHNGGDQIQHLEIDGRLPNGGRKVVDHQFELQQDLEDVDHVWSIPDNLGELITGFNTWDCQQQIEFQLVDWP